jgi:cytochrome b561
MHMPQPLVIGYSLVARLLHWATAIAVFIAVPLAIAAVNAAPGPDKGELFFWHKSFGVLIFVLVALRVLHRLVNGAPGPHPQLPSLEKVGSQAVHYILYLLLIAVPLGGWLGTSAMGHPPSFFGLFTLPPLLAENKELGEQIMDIHVVAAFTLGGLAAFHIIFALYHGLVRKDGVLTRMVFGTNRGIGPA